MKDKTDHPDKFQVIAGDLAKRLQQEFGEGCGFAIMVWNEGNLKHVTNDRNALAQMMGTQLVTWAQEIIAEEDRAIAALRVSAAETRQ